MPNWLCIWRSRGTTGYGKNTKPMVHKHDPDSLDNIKNDNKPEFINHLGEYQYGFSDPDVSRFKSRKGLDKEVVEQISSMKA